jgi:uncharacterized protein (TIGR03437 family)
MRSTTLIFVESLAKPCVTLFPKLSLVLLLMLLLQAQFAQAQTAFTSVSAAGYATTVTPDSIVAGFGGPNLAPSTASASSVPLPTTLAGTSVIVRDSAGVERSAGLFFVSSLQINYHVPAASAVGTATIFVRAGAVTVAQGTLEIANIAPAVFTANASGSGAPAGFAFRLRPDNSTLYENLFEFRNGSVQVRQVDFTPNGDRIFLVLYLSGLRRASRQDVQVILGGNTYTPDFIGPVDGFVGLDQLNVEVPSGLTGALSLAVTVNGFAAFNLTEIELTAQTQGATPQISSLGASLVTAGDELTINGSNFSATAEANEVYIVDSDQQALPAQITSASGTQLKARVPFGSGTGQVRLGKTNVSGATAALSLKTSISGFVETVDRQPLAGVKIKIVGTTREAITSATGTYVIADVPQGTVVMDIDGGNVNANPKYPQVSTKQIVRVSRDNQAPPLPLAQATGTSIPVGVSGVMSSDDHDVSASSVRETEPSPDAARLATELSLEVPAGAQASFPGGASSGLLTLTPIEGSRSPVDLPTGQFSSTIAQITPFGVTLSPGAKLIFPNNDGLPANSQATLFRFDFDKNSATVGQFVVVGTATVSSDGQRIETAANAITTTSYYFVSAPKQSAALYGHVVEADGRPVRRAVVQARGQTTFTDGNGGFVLRNVPVLKANEQITLTVSFMRPDQTVERTERRGLIINANSLTQVEPDIALSARTGNRAPTLLVPSVIAVTADEVRDFDFIAADPDPGQTVQISLKGDPTAFTTVSAQKSDVFRLRLNPAARNIGDYKLSITATDDAGARSSQTVRVLVTARSSATPTAQSQSVTTSEDVSVPVTLTGSDPGGSVLGFSLVSQPGNGSLKGTGASLTYSPDKNFSGVDSFTFKASSKAGESNVAAVYIVVNPVNDAPVLSVPASFTADAGQQIALTVSAADPDLGQTLNFSATGLPPGAAFANVSGTSRLFTWNPTFVQSGVYNITFKVTDDGDPSLSDERTVTITTQAQFAKTSGPEGGQINCFHERILPGRFGTSVGTLFAGTQGGGIYRSTDYGLTWNSVSEDLTENGLRVRAFASDSTAVYAGTQDGVWRSTDNGLSWQRFNNTVAGTSAPTIVNALLFDGTTLYAGTQFQGVLRLDKGAWAAMNGGLANAQGQLPLLKSLVIHNSTLFASSFDNVYSFNATTQTWSIPGSGVSGSSLYGINLLSTGATLLAAGNGIFRSTDNGRTWTTNTRTLAFPSGVSATSLVKTSGTSPMIFAGSNGSGVFVSTNDGVTWASVSTGLSPSGRIVQALCIFNVNSASSKFSIIAPQEGVSNILAGTWDGIFRTDTSIPPDAGREPETEMVRHYVSRAEAATTASSWKSVSTGLAATRMTRLFYAGTDLYAATFGSSLFRSSDNGQSWIPVDNGDLQGQQFIYALATTGIEVYAGGAGGAFVTFDRGKNWTRINGGFPGGFAAVQSLAVSGTTLYAGTAGSGLYKRATDVKGALWEELNTFPDKMRQMTALLVVPTRSSVTIYVGTQGGGIYRSTDGGASWVTVNTGLTGAGLNVFALMVKGSVLVAGTQGAVYRSTNGGDSWQSVSGTPFIPSLVEDFALFQNNIFAAAANGVFRSSDDGQNWRRISSGLVNDYTITLAVSDSRLFVGTIGNGVSVVANSSQSWSGRNVGLANKSTNAVAATGSTFIAGTLGSGTFRSTSQGSSWAAGSTGLPNNTNVQALSFNPGDGSVYAATFGDGLFRSTTQTSWTDVSAALPNKYTTAIAISGTNVFVGAVNDPRSGGAQGGVWRSTNAGQNWTEVNNGLSSRNINALLVTGGKLYAATDGGGVFVSSNNGDSWTAVNTGLTALEISSLTVVGTNLFAATTSSGIFRASLSTSTLSWTAVNTGLPSTLPVFALAAAGSRLYAGTVYGVFVSTDNGATWEQINAGLADLYVTSLTISGETLIAGTRNGGIFVSQIPQ